MVQDDNLVEAVKRDWRSAPLDDATKALLGYVEKLTLDQRSCSRDDIEALRRHGFSDEAILTAVHICGFFNLATRMADGLGVALEAEFSSTEFK